MSAFLCWKAQPAHEHGEFRVVTRILWLPTLRKVEGYDARDYEWRWLGREAIRQRYSMWLGWVDQEWAS